MDVEGWTVCMPQAEQPLPKLGSLKGEGSPNLHLKKLSLFHLGYSD